MQSWEREKFTPISPMTPAPQYQPIERKKRKGKKVKYKKGASNLI